jgi:TetR/AcrR family transcriptional regulator, transcriptional repressor for nem operon
VRSGNAANAITARSAATRVRILAETGGVIVRRGVEATAIDGIRQASEAGESHFYQHFSDKEDLVRSTLDDQAQALLSDQRQQLAEVTSLAGLDTWRDNLVAANRQRGGPFGCVLATMVAQLGDRDEQTRIQLAGYFAEWRRVAATTLLRLQTGGQLRCDADPDDLATGLIAALQGGYVLAQASRNVDHMATAIEMALARIRFFADHR